MDAQTPASALPYGEHRVDRVVWRLLCHPRSRRFEGRSHTVKFFQTPRQGHPSGYRRTTNFRRERLAGIYQHALEPNMPPSNFFGLPALDSTNFLRRHSTSPRSFLNSRATERFLAARLEKSSLSNS